MAIRFGDRGARPVKDGTGLLSSRFFLFAEEPDANPVALIQLSWLTYGLDSHVNVYYYINSTANFSLRGTEGREGKSGTDYSHVGIALVHLWRLSPTKAQRHSSCWL